MGWNPLWNNNNQMWREFPSIIPLPAHLQLVVSSGDSWQPLIGGQVGLPLPLMNHHDISSGWGTGTRVAGGDGDFGGEGDHEGGGEGPWLAGNVAATAGQRSSTGCQQQCTAPGTTSMLCCTTPCHALREMKGTTSILPPAVETGALPCGDILVLASSYHYSCYYCCCYCFLQIIIGCLLHSAFVHRHRRLLLHLPRHRIRKGLPHLHEPREHGVPTRGPARLKSSREARIDIL